MKAEGARLSELVVQAARCSLQVDERPGLRHDWLAASCRCGEGLACTMLVTWKEGS